MAPNGSIQNISMDELFENENEEENYVEDTEMPLGVRIFWDILFGSSIVISILGNISVLWTIIGHKHMWSVPNAFIVNISISDFLMTVFNCIFNYIYMRDRDWIFSDAYCVFNNFIAICTVAASVFSLSAMSINRYRAVVFPFKEKTSKRAVTGVMVLIWFGSSVLALPAYLFSSVVHINGTESDICVMAWSEQNDHAYNWIIMALTYFIPVVVISATSAHMGYILWYKAPVGIVTAPIERARMKKKKIVKMLAVLVLVFGICWFPYHGFFIYSNMDPKILELPYIQHVYLSFYWCAMSHAIVNPVVYCVMNKKFRQSFHRIFSFGWLKNEGPRIYAEKGASTILLTTLGMQVGGPQQTYDNGKTTTTMAKEKVVVGGNIDNIQVVVSSPSPIHRQPRKSISQVTEYFYDELMMADNTTNIPPEYESPKLNKKREFQNNTNSKKKKSQNRPNFRKLFKPLMRHSKTTETGVNTITNSNSELTQPRIYIPKCTRV